MPASKLNRIFHIARSAVPGIRKRHMSGKQEELKNKKQEMAQIRKEMRAAKEQQGETFEQRKIFKDKKREMQSKKREIFQLKQELRTARRQKTDAPDNGKPSAGAAVEPKTGSLPDFVIIGAQKSGTTTFHYLLAQHPLVRPPVYKELHFFDRHFDEGVEWYRRCFPPPRLKDGHETITGEATPSYLLNPLVPERAAGVVPQAQLIALLRNPADRAYSQYQKRVRLGVETRSFEEAVDEEAKRLLDEGYEMLEDERYADSEHRPSSYLARGLYAEQLLRWSEFYDRDQMLVLKSEDFFERPQEGLKAAQDFLGLPEWEPEALENRNKGSYESGMDPATRRRLEEYFEPHNQKLYEYLGKDFGW